MAIETRVLQGKTVFNDWEVKEYIGSGSGGKTAVFRIVRRHENWEETSALKVINVLEEMGRKDGLADVYRQEYEAEREELCRQAEEELRLMSCLRGNPYIVEYYDFLFVDYQEEYAFGTDLLIRMELLENLREEQKKKGEYSEGEILHIGKNICRSLQFCHQAGIIHRDIKPANIFVTAWGDYKLGDFGIARMLDAGQKASTKMGTRAYAAPEQFMSHQDKYDARVDIYSLGLTLYELSNHNRLPFASSGYVRESEIQLRIMGKEFPAPAHVGVALADVIRKACAYDAGGRYASAKELEDALAGVETGIAQRKKDSFTGGQEGATGKVDQTGEEPDVQTEISETGEDRYRRTGISETEDREKQFITPAVRLVGILVIVLCIFSFAIMNIFGNDKSVEKDEKNHFAGKTEEGITQESEKNEEGVPETQFAETEETDWENLSGQSGQNLTEFSLEMERVSNEYARILGEVAYVTATDDNVAVITEKNELYMWGENEYGQVGCGNTENQAEPVLIMEQVESVYLSEMHTAALTLEGDLYLWGRNSRFQIGNGTKENQLTPALVLRDVKDVSLGDYHSGALCNNGDLYGWGKADGNGSGTGTDQEVPVLIASNIVSFSMNGFEGGAVTEDGKLYVWGMNWSSEPGLGIQSPTLLMGDVKSVQIGQKTVAAVKTNGDLYMWGYNESGQVGNGEMGAVYAPELILEDVESVALENGYSAAITEDGTLYMWGGDDEGRIGVDGDVRYLTPQKIAEDVESVYLGECVSAFVKEDGVLYLCGANGNRQITESQQLRIDVPTAVAQDITSVGLCIDKTYAVRKDGSLYRWGK